MGYSQINKKGTMLYLHTRTINLKNGGQSKIFWFSGKNTDETCDLPKNKIVIEAKSGLLFCHNKTKK